MLGSEDSKSVYEIREYAELQSPLKILYMEDLELLRPRKQHMLVLPSTSECLMLSIVTDGVLYHLQCENQQVNE